MVEADCDYSEDLFEVMVCSERKLLNSLAIKWTIEPLITIDSIKTPKFELLPGVKCFIELEAGSDFYDFIVSVDDCDSYVECKFSVSDIKGNLLFDSCVLIECSETFRLESEAFETIKNKCLDVLMCKCILKIYGDISTTTCNKKFDQSSKSLVLPNLASDLRNLLDSQLLPDVNLVFGKDTVPAHKAILCARSPVFAKMFEHDTVEREKNSVTINDLELSVATNLLTFLYSGQLCDSDFDSYYNLYYAADKYLVSDLRQMCGEALLSHLKIDNACQALSLADQYSDKVLSSKVLDFIKLNLKSVIKTDGWTKYIDGKLSSQIFSDP